MYAAIYAGSFLIAARATQYAASRRPAAPNSTRGPKPQAAVLGTSAAGYTTNLQHEEDEDDEDDLLSESPEFLDKDTDEGLWFEKGPPKDFDFEDEDEE